LPLSTEKALDDAVNSILGNLDQLSPQSERKSRARDSPAAIKRKTSMESVMRPLFSETVPKPNASKPFNPGVVQQGTEKSSGIATTEIPSSQNFKMGTAAFQFTAHDSSELSIDPGQVVTVEDYSDGDWWFGSVKDLLGTVKKGYFPANFVKLKRGGTLTGGRSPVTAATIMIQVPVSYASVSGISGDTTPSAKEVLPWQCKAKIIFDYLKKADDELSVKKGQIVSVYEPSDDDWWEGMTESGNIGLFPSSYARLL